MVVLHSIEEAAGRETIVLPAKKPYTMDIVVFASSVEHIMIV